MEFLVVYFSRGGNTRKVAEAIAQELGCKAVDVKKETPDISGVDLLLVGSGDYWGKPGKQLLSFLNNLKPSNSRAVVFATSRQLNAKSMYVMQEALEKKGYTVISSFKCCGMPPYLNRGPTEDDLNNAKAFACDLKERVHE